MDVLASIFRRRCVIQEPDFHFDVDRRALGTSGYLVTN